MDFNSKINHYFKSFPNQTANGVLGVAADYENNAWLEISQTTANITLTSPTPVNTPVGARTLIKYVNSGSVDFTINGYRVLGNWGHSEQFHNGTIWVEAANSSNSYQPNEVSRSTVIANGIAGTTCNLGELQFRYSANATNGNIEILSSTSSPVICSILAREQFSTNGASVGVTSPITINAIGGAWTLINCGAAGIHEKIFMEVATATNRYEVSVHNFNDTNIHLTARNKANQAINSTLSGNIVAMTPVNAGPETVVSFDGIEMKWHNSSASGYDGIAMRVTTGSRQFRFSQVEFYTTSAVADAGKSVWGSDNTWYNLPNTGTTATVSNPTFPYNQVVNTNFIGIGNPALPQTDMRETYLYDMTNNAAYRIGVNKQASTGEALVPQVGSCMIVVEKLGVTTSQILTPGAGIAISSGVISTTSTGSTYVGANGTSAGIPGLVNSAAIGQQNSVYKGDGNFTPPSGLQAIGNNVSIGTTGSTARLNIGLSAVVASAAPDDIDMGNSFSSVAGANPKIKMFNNAGAVYGFGVSNAQSDYITPAGSSHVFYIAGTEKMRLNNNGNFGLNNPAPLTNFDNIGSESKNFITTLATPYVALATDNIIYLQSNSPQDAQLPGAGATNIRRVVTVVNNTISQLKTVTSYFNEFGTLVNTVPANGSITLQSNGTNWIKIGGTSSRTPNVQTFLANGTYTPTPGMKYCVVEMVGAGGGGGFAFGLAGANESYVGIGGNSGAYVKVKLDAAQVAPTQAITVGAGTNGNGGSSSIGSIATATGGISGTGIYCFSQLTRASATASPSQSRATFGISVGIDLGSQLGNIASEGRVASYTANCQAVTSDGADSAMGKGARGLKAPSPQWITAPGNFNAQPALANTGGGASGDATYSPTAANGVATTAAAGGSGKVVITEYFN